MESDYARIEKAITYILENYSKQPSLSDIAGHVYLSPFHFQRLFQDWAGVTPKTFLQYISLQHAKDLLNKNLSLSDVSMEVGFTGTSRLHDLFITIEGMTPGEFKKKGESLFINYSFAETMFGSIIMAATKKGLCYLAFYIDERSAFAELQNTFPNAVFNLGRDEIQENTLLFFNNDWKDIKALKLHLKGTAFQLKVWNSLLQIPLGGMRTYGSIAGKIEHGNASRAVGTAIGQNVIAFLIPCHRVIRSSGVIGEYRWGSSRKVAMLGWEAAKVNMLGE